MCVRVIMTVVNCRLDYKYFLLWYSSITKVTVQNLQWKYLVISVTYCDVFYGINGIINCRLNYKQFCSVMLLSTKGYPTVNVASYCSDYWDVCYGDNDSC